MSEADLASQLRWLSLLWRASVLVFALSAGACGRSASDVSGPLPQRGYLWQQNWTAAVSDAVLEAQKHMDGVVLLAAEIRWAAKKPEVVKPNIDWGRLALSRRSCGIALRIGSCPEGIAADRKTAQLIIAVAKSVLHVAAAQEVTISELQIDYDCRQKNLRVYSEWVRVLREAVHPVPVVLTTLPAWLDDRHFARLVTEADGYVLQVHSVSAAQPRRHVSLCDSRSATIWVSKAARLGLPFSVALPTYRCSAGYGPGGQLLSVALDSVQPVWPPNTRVLEFSTDPDQMAALVKQWRTGRPRQLREIIWYRIPVPTDVRNWRWPTLAAVMSGRTPGHRLEISQEGENPVDLSITNTGEADEQLDSTVTASCSTSSAIAADALPGWVVNLTSGRAVFTPTPEYRMRLQPGGKRQIGWIRYERPPGAQLKLASKQ